MTGPLPPTTRSLPIAMIRARERIMAPIRDMLAETGITEQQWRVLRVLAEHGPQDASDLADKASLLAPSLTRILKTLSTREFISRTQDTDDRRRQLVAISETGQKIIDDNAAEAAQIVAQFKTALGVQNYELLLDLLDQLSDFEAS